MSLEQAESTPSLHGADADVHAFRKPHLGQQAFSLFPPIPLFLRLPDE